MPDTDGPTGATIGRMTRDTHRPLREAWIVEAVRTPIGRYGGALGEVRPDDLAAAVLRGLVDRTGIDPALVDDVILGCANQAGEDNRNVGADGRAPGRISRSRSAGRPSTGCAVRASRR